MRHRLRGMHPFEAPRGNDQLIAGIEQHVSFQPTVAEPVKTQLRQHRLRKNTDGIADKQSHHNLMLPLRFSVLQTQPQQPQREIDRQRQHAGGKHTPKIGLNHDALPFRQYHSTKKRKSPCGILTIF